MEYVSILFFFWFRFADWYLRVVFVGCCIAGAVFSLLLPEVRARDPDLVLAEELKEGHA